MHVRMLASLLLVLGAAAPAAYGQGRAGGPVELGADATSTEYVLRTQFLEAINGAKWRDAIGIFQEMRKAFPQVLGDLRLVFAYAQALYNVNDKAASATQLEELLQIQDNHVDALFLLAQIMAQSGKDQDKERAKDYLVQSARAGQFVLRDISSKEGEKIFGEALRDSSFIVRVMAASSEFQVGSAVLHNPFASPLQERQAGEDDLPIDPREVADPRLEELEKRIEELFRDILKLAEQRNVEELITKFTELRALMNEFGSSGTAEVRKKLERFNQRLQDLGEVRLSIQLQVYISEGNQYLRAMAEAIRADEYDQALEHFTRIEELCDQMRAEEREVFHRNAEALYLRGKANADRARRLKRIAEFQLNVEGVVLAPPGGSEPHSTIINDRIYREGDMVIDRVTDEPVAGLRVVEILRTTVRFRFEDTEFIRELKPPQ